MEHLQAAFDHMPKCYEDDERIAAVYNEAVATKTRMGAPLASFSIDRKCLKKGAHAMEDGKIEGLVCFLCACVHVRVSFGLSIIYPPCDIVFGHLHF